jgi:hypothetical protein
MEVSMNFADREFDRQGCVRMGIAPTCGRSAAIAARPDSYWLDLDWNSTCGRPNGFAAADAGDCMQKQNVPGAMRFPAKNRRVCNVLRRGRWGPSANRHICAGPAGSPHRRD